MLRCPKCGAECGDGEKFCQECGAPIPQEKECPQCHAKVKPTAKFCGECGYRFGAPSAVPEAAAGQSIGDKNVIAGDVQMIGRQESFHIAGAATIATSSSSK